MLLPYLSNGFGSDPWPRRIDWVGLYKSSDHPSTWIFRCLEFQVWEANFCWLIRVTSVIVVVVFPLIRTAWFVFNMTLPLLVDWNNFNKKCVSTQAWGFKRREHRSRQMLFWPADGGGLQSAPIPWSFLGHGRCCKPWRCRLEHFFGPRPEKVPWNLAFFKRELHDQRRCEPCLYYRKQGCWYRDECRFCHLCTAEQIRKWQSRQHYNRNGRADSITIEERSTEKSCKRKDRRWTLGWDSSTVTRDSGARFESS